MWRTPATLAAASTTSPTPASAELRDPRHRDQLRRHLRGGRHRRRRDPRQRHLLARACTTATAASCPRSPRATTSSWPTPSSTTRSRAPARRSTTSSSSRSPAGPGLVGALLVGVATAKALAARARPAARRRSTTSRATSPRTSSSAGRRSSRRSCAWSPAAATRSWRRVDDHDGFTVLGQTLDDAAGEAIDKGARLLGLPFPGGPHLERLAARRRPRAPSRSRRPAARRPGLLVRRAEDRAALQGARPRRGRGAAPPRRPRRLLPARDRRAARAARASARWSRPACDRLAIGGGVAANGPLRERLAALGAARARPAARAVHRQRGDDRRRRALRRAAAVPGLPRRSTPTRPAWTGRERRRSCTAATGCHLCDEARASCCERVGEPVRARSTSRPTTSCSRATSSASRSSRSTARSCTTSSSTSRTCAGASRVRRS